jgi:hypothetical protein
MKPTDNISRLVDELADRRLRKDSAPPLLFLGTKCGEAAGVPGPEVMAPKVLAELRDSDKSLFKALLPDGDLSNEDEVVSAFLRLLGGMTDIQRYRVLYPFYSRVPVPLFYQDLATLISAGVFTHILTTNVDALLEQALSSAGLRRKADYDVMVLSVPRDPTGPPEFSPDVPVLIVKLHGDLGQTEIPIGDLEIEQAIRSQRLFVKGELRGDIVMVGYEFESMPIEDWLKRMTVGAELWWVNPEPPDQLRMAPIEQSREVIYIERENADPQNFFGVLATMLLRVPVTRTLTTSFDEFVKASASGQTSPDAISRGIPQESEADLELEVLRGQLQRAQTVKRSIEQTLPSGDSSTQQETQLEYQRKQATQLEDEVRARGQHLLVELMQSMEDAVARTQQDPSRSGLLDPDTVGFLNEQISAVRRESSKPDPNQHVVSAAMGALSVMADRLGRDVFPEDVTARLASFSPGGVTA